MKRTFVDKMMMHILIRTNSMGKDPEAWEHIVHLGRGKCSSIGGVRGCRIGKALEHKEPHIQCWYIKVSARYLGYLFSFSGGNLLLFFPSKY